MEMKKNSR